MRRISEEIRNNIAKDLKELNEYGKYKYSYRELAKKYNIGHRTVYRIVKENNLNRKNEKITKEIRNNVIKNLKELDEYGKYKYNYREIATKYNISYTTVYNIAGENNLSRDSKRKLSKNLTNKIVKDLKKLDEYGNYKYRYEEIAKFYGISHIPICGIAKENNLLRPRNLSPIIINSIIDSLKSLNEDGSYKYTYREISKKYNISYMAVYRIAKENNLTRRN